MSRLDVTKTRKRHFHRNFFKIEKQNLLIIVDRTRIGEITAVILKGKNNRSIIPDNAFSGAN